MIKYFILFLLSIYVSPSFSLSCDSDNYKDFIYNIKLTDQLIAETGVGCILINFNIGWKAGYIEDEIRDLPGSNFRLADLIGANLRNINFSYSNFSGADLRATNFEGANLTEANLSKTDLRGSYLFSTNLSYANLSKSDLRKVYLRNINFSYSNFREADLRGTQFIEGIFFSFFNSNNLNSADFRGAFYNKDTTFPDDFNPEEKGMIYKQ